MYSTLPRTIGQLCLTPRKILGFLLLCFIAAYFVWGPGEAELLEQQAYLKAEVDRQPALWSGLFFAIMFLLIAFSVPVASGMMALGGFLFGRWHGLVVCHPATVLGAVAAMVLSRYLFQAPFRRIAARSPRIHGWLAAADEGIERSGWYYLLLLRLTPIIPFFTINVLMGLTRIRVSCYSWVTAVGTFPATFIFVNAGAAVSHIHSIGDIVSLETLLSLMLLVLAPVLLRILLPRERSTAEIPGNSLY